MKKEKLKKWLPWIFVLYFAVSGWLKLDASFGNANILTDIRSVGQIYGPEFDRITVHGISYERGDIPQEFRGGDWYFVGYVTSEKHSMKVSSPEKWDDENIPDYLWAMWGYDGYTYRRAEN